MRVSVDHSRVTDSRRVEVELHNIVQHMEHEPANLDIGCHRKSTRPLPIVHIPTNGERGSKLTKRIDYIASPDVPGVNDEVCALQRSDGLGPKQPVSIGDDADQGFATGHLI